MDSLLNILQVAEKAGISKPTIFRLMNLGQFPPGLKLGRRRLWHPAILDKWLAAQHQNVKRGGER